MKGGGRIPDRGPGREGSFAFGGVCVCVYLYWVNAQLEAAPGFTEWEAHACEFRMTRNNFFLKAFYLVFFL